MKAHQKIYTFRKLLLNKKPLEKRGFKGGPTWARTKDQMIMSHLL